MTARRLAAILAADVVGFSKLIGDNEEGTLSTLRKIRREIVNQPFAEHGRRIFKMTGNGMLLCAATLNACWRALKRARDRRRQSASARATIAHDRMSVKLRRVGLLWGSLRGPLLKGGAFKDRLAGRPFHFVRCCVGHARFPPKHGFLLERRSPSAVRIVLAEKGLSFLRDETYTTPSAEERAKVTPTLQVPTLIEGASRKASRESTATSFDSKVTMRRSRLAMAGWCPSKFPSEQTN
jgi:hypothetical protein